MEEEQQEDPPSPNEPLAHDAEEPPAADQSHGSYESRTSLESRQDSSPDLCENAAEKHTDEGESEEREQGIPEHEEQKKLVKTEPNRTTDNSSHTPDHSQLDIETHSGSASSISRGSNDHVGNSPEIQNHGGLAGENEAFREKGDIRVGCEDVKVEGGESVMQDEERITENGEYVTVSNSDHSTTNKPLTNDIPGNSPVRTKIKQGVSPLPDENIRIEESCGQVVPPGGEMSDIDGLDSAEDVLLSQLDAELDEGGEGSSGLPDVDAAVNGLTKEAVIEGLVEYQKIKTELEQLKERHKKKSSNVDRTRAENESLKEQLAEAKERIISQDSQLKEKENALKSQQFRNKEPQDVIEQPEEDLNKSREKLRAHDAEAKKAFAQLQQELILQVVIEQHKEDLDKSREKLRAHDAAAKKAIAQLQQELIVRVNQVKGMYDEVMKEKENMVLKYAKSEKEVLDMRKAKEIMERKYKEGQALVESNNTQMKQMRAEVSKVKGVAATKDAERASLQKEVEQLKEEVNSQAIKVKWAQNKLKSELDVHKETKAKLTKTEQRLAEAKEETETIRKNCQEMIKQYQESEEVKSNSLGIQLKKTEAELQIREQETTDQLEVHNAKLKELTSLKQAHSDATAELESLRVKVKCLEDERIQQEEYLTQFKVLLNNQKEANRNLSKELEEAKEYQVQLKEAEENARQLEDKLGHIQEDGKDLEASLAASQEKESELLQFTEKITTKNAELHAEIGSLQSKVETLAGENKSLQSQLEDINSKYSQLSTDLQREKEYREREVLILTTRLNEKSRNEENLSLKLEEAKDEAKTLKRRHVANTKDLTRQLQQAKKRLESIEKDGQGGKENNSMGSRTSSSGSLETAGAPGQSTPNSARGSISGPPSEASPGTQSPQVTISSGNNDFPGIDKGMLVERIIRLQRLQQKYKEKIEFFQEHNRSLIEVIQKKNKIIQGYVLREETGALSTAASDIHKAQMAKQSGIMASLYRSQASDPKMTLDLSLEINQKLQAVLEDTLLKNITLKENIDTLGREIARLSEDLFNAKEILKSRGK